MFLLTFDICYNGKSFFYAIEYESIISDTILF